MEKYLIFYCSMSRLPKKCRKSCSYDAIVRWRRKEKSQERRWERKREANGSTKQVIITVFASVFVCCSLLVWLLSSFPASLPACLLHRSSVSCILLVKCLRFIPIFFSLLLYFCSFPGAYFQNLRLMNGSLSYHYWQRPGVIRLTKVYIFNVTNADGFLNNGEKPKLTEVGPFVYR